MKKIAILMVLTLLLSACSGTQVTLDVEGDVGVDLLPGESGEDDGQNGQQSNQTNEQQPQSSGDLLTNPIVIILLVLFAILVVLLVFTRGIKSE